MSATNVPNPEGENGQPIRAPSGLPFGERQQIVQQQRAAPTQRQDGPPEPSGPPQRGMVGGVFGPTQQPREPVTARARRDRGGIKPDPDTFLKAIYRRFPHPDIERLLLQ